MTSSTTLLCLSVAICSIYTVTGYNYQKVSLCPNVAGDPSFTTRTVTSSFREVLATTSVGDAANNRCIFIKKGVFYVTNVDSSITMYKFNSLYDEGSGTFIETGPDGNQYTVIVLKSYGPECGNMNLLVRCSDTVGSVYNPIIVKLHATAGAQVSYDCVNDAKNYAEHVLGKEVNFNFLSNTDCATINNFC